ncbi:hypothetical protein A5883_003093 [Enterococcus sp. 5B3_DIV0040]|nr:hypothetical protein A5883_003093 [Enterococcus sp. 5B3_DIV0040]
MEEGGITMNHRLMAGIFLLGMCTQFLPFLLRLGLFCWLGVYLYLAWDEFAYRRRQAAKRANKEEMRDVSTLSSDPFTDIV